MLEHSPSPELPFSGCTAGPGCPFLSGAERAGLGALTNPTAHALASWRYALWGQQGGAQGGGLMPLCGVSLPPPPPAACPWGGRPGPGARVPWL